MVSPERWPGLLFADVTSDSIRFYGKSQVADEACDVELCLQRGDRVVHGFGSRVWPAGTLIAMNAERAVVGGAQGALFQVALFDLFRMNDAFRRSVAGGAPPHQGDRVSVANLLATPHAFDGSWVTVEGIYRTGLELSSLAGAWVQNGFREMGTHYVLATGLWRSEPGRGYGHFGMSSSELVAETIERASPSRIVDLERIEDVAAHEHEVVRVRGVVSQSPSRSSMGAFSLSGMPNDFEGLREVELVAVGDARQLTVLETKYLGEARPHPATTVASVADAARHVGEFVRLTGTMERGAYWPTIDAVEIVPPELYRKSGRFVGSSRPADPEVVKWNERLAGGSVRVQLEAFVYSPRKLFTTRLEVL